MEDTLKKVAKYLEKYVFYIDTAGYIALKPKATKNYKALMESLKAGEMLEITK